MMRKNNTERDISQSVNDILNDIENDISEGKTSDIYRKAKSLSSHPKGSSFVQPSVDPEGNIITSSEQQLEEWAKFLENKFAARENEPVVDLSNSESTDETVPVISVDEVKT